MTRVRITDFGGRIPIRSPRLLPPNFATVAKNLNMQSGELRGLRKPQLIHTFPDGTAPKRVWQPRAKDSYTDTVWQSSPHIEAELVQSPLVNDTRDRWYLFEPDTKPKVNTFDRMKLGLPYYDLALPTPTIELDVTASATSPIETRVYTYTLVSEWGEETAPGPTTLVSVTEGGNVTISGPALSPSVLPVGRSFEFVRLYRTVTGEQSDSYFFVADIPVGAINYVDKIPNSTVVLNSTLDTWNFDAPPEGLVGVKVHPSGALVGFKGRDVWFSVPYMPHVWPEIWKKSVPDDIVGVEIFEQNVIVLTTSQPVVLYGSSPDTLGILRYPRPEPCMSYRSIVGSREGVLYVSHRGLVMINGSGINLVTEQIIDENTWLKEFIGDEADFSTVYYNGQFIALQEPGKGYIIDLHSDKAFVSTFEIDLPITGVSAGLYFGEVYATVGDYVYLWEAPAQSEVEYVWKSGELYQEQPVNFGAVQVHLDEANDPYAAGMGYVAVNEALVRIWADGSLVFEQGVPDRTPIRMPSGFRADVWEVEITAFCRVKSFIMAETIRELRSA